jgi:hypothetical protein
MTAEKQGRKTQDWEIQAFINMTLTLCQRDGG